MTEASSRSLTRRPATAPTRATRMAGSVNPASRARMISLSESGTRGAGRSTWSAATSCSAKYGLPSDSSTYRSNRSELTGPVTRAATKDRSSVSVRRGRLIRWARRVNPGSASMVRSGCLGGSPDR